MSSGPYAEKHTHNGAPCESQQSQFCRIGIAVGNLYRNRTLGPERCTEVALQQTCYICNILFVDRLIQSQLFSYHLDIFEGCLRTCHETGRITRDQPYEEKYEGYHNNQGRYHSNDSFSYVP